MNSTATRLMILILSCLAFIAAVRQADAADKVRLGFSALSLANSPAWIAEEKGIFKKYDIEPELIVVGGGATRAVSAVLAGDLQFGTTGGGAAISAALGGADVVMVAAGNNKGVQRLMVKPEIKTPEALKGKRIGVTNLGSSGHLALLLLQRKWGQNPEDIQVVQLGSSPVMLISLQKNGIDGAVLQDPSFFMAEDAGFRTLADPAAMGIQYLQNVVVSSRAYLRSHRDAAQRFIKAFVEGVAYFKKNKDESMRILMKKMRIEKGQETYLERSYHLYAGQYIENVPAASVTGAKTVLEFLVKDFPKAKTADPNSFIDNSLVKPLEDSGFIKALYQ